MSQETHYFKLGLFTLVTLVLLIITIIIFGAGNFFTPCLSAETYFDGSVKNLSVGSPVKFRGVTIGKVDDIKIVGRVYGKGGLEKNGDEQHYIYVKFSIIPQSSKTDSINTERDLLKQSIKKGLRVSLATQDLVGNVFLELNFVKKNKETPLKITWKPENLYIPSYKSTFSRFTDSLDTIFTSLSTVDFKGLFNNFNQFITNANKTLDQANVGEISNQLTETLTNINTLIVQLNQILNSERTKEFSDSIYDDATLFKQTLQETTETMEKLNSLISRTTEFSASQQQTIANTLSNLDEMSANLQNLSSKLDNNPSALLFSKPAQPMDLSK